MKLSPGRRTELMNELRLRVLFRDKALMRRYGVNRSKLARLQREALKRPMAGESTHVVWWFHDAPGSTVRAAGLSPERRAELINEVRLRALFRDKALMRRYGVSRSTLARLRCGAETLDEQPIAQNVASPRGAGTLMCGLWVCVLNSERALGVRAA